MRVFSTHIKNMFQESLCPDRNTSDLISDFEWSKVCLAMAVSVERQETNMCGAGGTVEIFPGQSGADNTEADPGGDCAAEENNNNHQSQAGQGHTVLSHL